MKINTRTAFSCIVSLFFAWGFLTAMNDILVPHFRQMFNLSYVQSMLVNFAFFGAYFLGSAIYFLYSLKAGDPIAKLGYKSGIIIGLILSAGGAFLFIPAAEWHEYALFLTALFTLGLGFTLLQISANPYATVLGNAETASARLNLAQAFNSLGKTLAPLAGAYLILSDPLKAETTTGPYMAFGFALLSIAAIIFFIPLPAFRAEQNQAKQGNVLSNVKLQAGILAIFFYVGAEVSIGSLLVSFVGLPQTGSFEPSKAAVFVALYLAGEMTGRFIGSVGLSDRTHASKLSYILLIVLSMAGVIAWQFDLQYAVASLLVLLLNASLVIFNGNNPARLIGVFSVTASLLLIGGSFLNGMTAVACVVSIGLFNSIMWSNIFSQAIKDLGPLKSQGSSLLVMAIIGGALLPLLQGWMADLKGVQLSYLVPVISYLYLSWYAFKKQN